LDEPTNHLDAPAREAVEAALALFPGSVIAVSHDRSFLNSCVNKLFIIENKRLTVFSGNWDDYQKSKNAPVKIAPAKKKPMKPAKVAGNNSNDKAKSLEAVEAEILALEASKTELEKRFEQGEHSERIDYEEYANIDAKLTMLYAEWEELYQ